MTTMTPDDTWFDDEAGPLVRPYALTRGRTRTHRAELDLATLVVSVPPDPRFPAPALEPEYWEVLEVCENPLSIAEISARLKLPLGVVKILVGDLIDRRRVIHRDATAPEPEVLKEVLNGLRKL